VNVHSAPYTFDSLQPGRSMERIQMEATFYVPVQKSPGTHPAFYTMGTGSFPGVDHPFLLASKLKTKHSSWLRHCATRWEVPASISYMVLWNFRVAYSFCPHLVYLGFTQPIIEMSTKEFFWGGWGKVRLERKADGSAFTKYKNYSV
jgi:hypothetical protein